MLLTNLADVARASGLRVVEVDGWQSRGHGQFVAVLGAICHHTAGAATGNAPSLTTVRDGRADLAGPLANIVLARDATVFIVAAGVAYHAGTGSGFGLPINGANARTVGIEAESTGRGDWTAAQLDAYPRLLAALAAGYGFGVGMCIGHLEWAPHRKIDPAGWPGGMAGMRATTSAVLGGAVPVTSPATPATRVPVPASPALLAVDGDFGPLTKRALQRALGVEADGLIGPITVRALQRKVGATVDGVWGPQTTRALQRVLGVTVDGAFGPQSTRALQSRLNAATF